MRLPSKIASERGVALVATLLAMMLIVGLMAGAFAAINSDMRSNAIDRDQSQAYSAAHAGLEKLTSDLATLFTVNVSPTVGQINALETFPPNIAGFQYTAPGGAPGSGYDITWLGAPGAPQTLANNVISAGPYAGFRGMITPYTMTVTARSTTGGAEVRLRRELNTVAVPVFQFGVFSEGDLTFYAGDDFNFGGRVHTNGHLFLAEATNQRLSFSDKMTAVGDVVRQNLSNGEPIANVAFGGTVQILTAPPGVAGTGAGVGTGYTAMTTAMGSITGMPVGPVGNPPWANPPNAIANWPTYSNGAAYFKGNIKNRFTGATQLRLPLVSQGANPIDLIRRPALNSNEDTANAIVFGQRLYAQASLRILLSDRAADITGLPTITAGAPVALAGNWNAAPPAGYAGAPIARSMGPLAATTIAAAPANVAANNWTLTVNAIPAQFRLPTVAQGGISVDLGGGVWHTMECQGKSGSGSALNANQFINCAPTLPIGIPAGRQVRATLPSGAVVTTTTASANNVLGGATLWVAEDGTAAFWPISFFTHAPANAASTSFPTPVSCTGYTEQAPVRFLGCAWATGVGQGIAPANGQTISNHALQAADVDLIGGFIKIERQDHNGGAGGTWTDVTMEILNLGIGGPNLAGIGCADPNPNAILRIQRLKDNAFPNTVFPANPNWVCPSTGMNAHDWWPNTLYDTREGSYRDLLAGAPGTLGGAMQYIGLNMNNLRLWFEGNLGASGAQSLNRQGFVVYFSDRRGDHNDAAGEPETGKYGFEDVVNRNVATGLPNGVIDLGEDVDGWGADNLLGTADDEVGAGVLDVYGRTPWFVGGVAWAGATAPYDAAGVPEVNINSAQGRVNRQVLFRRALKLMNGGINAGVNSLPADGLTVASENPVYVHGNYNATVNPNANPDNDVSEPNVPAAIIADAVTVLSNNWSDAASFRFPSDRSQRPAINSGYRFAVIAGKNVSFPYAGTAVPAGTVRLLGTDGGMGNFLRLLEDWTPAGTQMNYRGSVVSLFNSRQATGTFKWGPNVYGFPAVRNFQFDSDFLVPTLLPPATPMFRDVNTLNFRQMLRPTQ